MILAGHGQRRVKKSKDKPLFDTFFQSWVLPKVRKKNQIELENTRSFKVPQKRRSHEQQRT